MKTKRMFLAVFCVLAAASSSVHAQELRHAISIDVFLPAMSPVSKLAGEDSTFVPINLMYQHVLTEHQVLMMKIGLNYSWGTGGETSRDIYPMLALEWHPFDTGLKGFYAGPSVFFNYSTHSYSRTPASDSLDYSRWAAVGGNIGYEYALPSRVVVDLIFGLGYGYSREVDVNGKVTSNHLVDETIGGVFVGYRF